MTDELASTIARRVALEEIDVGGVGGTLAGNALSLAAMRATLAVNSQANDALGLAGTFWAWMESDRLSNSVFREFFSERDVVHEVWKVFVLRDGAPQHQHKGLAPVCVDVGCGISEPAYLGPPRCRHEIIQAIDK